MKQLFAFMFAILYCGILVAQDGSSLTRGSVYKDDKNSIGQYTGAEQTVVFQDDFNGDNTEPGLTARGWIFVNVDGGGTTTTIQGSSTSPFPPFEGAGFVAQNYNGANGFYINQWLITPSIAVAAGDTMSFWYRGTGSTWPDSVAVKFSPTGGSTPADFTVDWGKSLVPATWTRKVFVIPTGGNVRFAVQYLMYDGGPSGNSSDYWGMDMFMVTGPIVPVELASFTAKANEDVVNLNWITATEKNNSGFQVERKIDGGNYQVLGFVNGKGTTTEQQEYTYRDSKLASGKYFYRLKQVDFDGTSTYSPTVEVDVVNPTEFSLHQNYPNPFNPSTSIKFSLPFESNISLTVYNAIGQVVDVIASGKYSAGVHTINFDASKLNSGIYLYKLNANSIDGKGYTFTKKMILTK